MSIKKIGFIGLGNIGAPKAMAESTDVLLVDDEPEAPGYEVGAH